MDAPELTIGKAATEFGLSRDVLRRVLSEAGVTPSGTHRGNPAYRIRDIARAIRKQDGIGAISPQDRLAALRAAAAEDALRRSRGELIDAAEVTVTLQKIVAVVVRGFDSLIDSVERSGNLTPTQISVLQKHLDETRGQLHAELTGGAPH